MGSIPRLLPGETNRYIKEQINLAKAGKFEGGRKIESAPFLVLVQQRLVAGSRFHQVLSAKWIVDLKVSPKLSVVLRQAGRINN